MLAWWSDSRHCAGRNYAFIYFETRPSLKFVSFSSSFSAEYGEKTVQKLNLRIDNIMNDLVSEKMKTQNVNDEVDQTFDLFISQ